MANPVFFYNRTIFNNSVALSQMFSNLVVYRLDTSGSPTKEAIPFPITFGPVDSIYAQRKADLNATNEKYYQPVLKGGLVLDSFDFAKERVMGQNEYLNLWNPTSAFTNMTAFYKEINPTPFNFKYTLQIRSAKFEYIAQVVEQIAPYFYPQQNIRVKELSYLNLDRHLKVTVENYPFEFAKELEMDEKREIILNIPIILEGFLYRPLGSEKIIKYINTEYFINEEVDISANSFHTSAYDLSASYPSPTIYDTSGTNDNGVTWFANGI